MRFKNCDFKGKFSPIGIDLGTNNVKLLQLRHERKKIFLHCTHLFPRSSFSLEEKNGHHEELALQLKEKLAEYGFRGKKVNISLGNGKFIIRSFKLPDMEDKDVSQAVRWEGENQITIPSHSRVTDYICRRGKNADGKEVINVHLVAAPMQNLKGYLDICALAGLRPGAVEIESFAVSRIFRMGSKVGAIEDTNKNNKGITLLLDLGGECSNAIVMENGFYAYCRHINLGINRLIDRLASIKEIFTDKGYQVLFRKDILAFPGVADIITEIAAEVTRTLDTYQYRIRDRGGEFFCREVYLCGGGSNTMGIEDFFLHTASEGVKRYNFFDSMGIGDSAHLVSGEKTLFNVAGGLALRSWLINEK